MPNPSPGHRKRTIRSYVRRTGRITKRQEKAYRRLYKTYGIPRTNEQLTLDEIFQRSAPVVLEIGIGMGDATVEIAAKNLQNNYLAIDVHPAGIGNLVAHIEEIDISNIRIIEGDALEVLEQNIQDNTLTAIHIFFPDPWPKKRHQKRRLIKTETTGLFCKKLQVGGYIHVATDWQDYAEQVLEIFNNEKSLRNTAVAFTPRPKWRPVTKFEKKAIAAGRQIFDIHFKRV